jgi:hypothetical protein
MEDGSSLGRNDASMLVENTDWGLDVPLLFTYLVPTMFKTLFRFPFDILSVITIFFSRGKNLYIFMIKIYMLQFQKGNF